MEKFNRRNWLKATSLLATGTALGGITQASPTLVPSGDSNGMRRKLPIYLSSNENPYGPSNSVKVAIKNAFDIACRYPGKSSLPTLMEMIAEKEGVSTDMITLTGGSTEGLKITGSYYGMNGGEIIAPRPTFLSMMYHANNFGSITDWVGVKKDMILDLDKIKSAIDENSKLIFLCNPNNPTSTIVDKNELREFVSTVSERVTVFSDEAYYDFIEEEGYPTMTEYVKEGKDVIVSRTFSKVYGLAGLRIGYLIAKPEITKNLRQRVVAFTNVLAIEAAIAALKDDEFYNHSIETNRKCKKMIYATLDELSLNYVKSHTNFIFFESGREIRMLQKDFRSKGIEIGRPFPPFNKWCRISTGKIEEVEKFCITLKELYA